MNEVFFFLHVCIVLVFCFISLKLGKKTLVALMAILAILANLFVQKQIQLFGLTITCTDVFSIGAMFSFNLLQEFFGQKEGKQAIKTTFFILFFFAVMSKVHMVYQPSPIDTAQVHYEALLEIMPRIFLASFAVFFLSQWVDLRIFSLLKAKFSNLSFAQRSFISMSISQFTDTVLFTYLALYGVLSNLWHVILVSYLIKVSIISFNSIFSKFLLKRKYGFSL